MTASLISRLGIQSWCFRTFTTHEQIIGALQECGVSGLEMCGVHFDPMKSAGAEELLGKYKKAGVSITAFGVNNFDTDEAKGRKIFEFAKAAGFSAISADFKWEALPLVEKLCAEFNIKAAVHNHGRKHRWGPAWALEELFAKSSPNIGLCLDTAWALDSGDKPLAVAEKFRTRLYGVHLKDFTFEPTGRPKDVIVGSGNLNLPEFAAFLEKTDFAGYLTLEYEGNKDNPLPSVKQCLEAVKAAFSH